MTLFIESRHFYVRGTLGEQSFRIGRGSNKDANFTSFYFEKARREEFSEERFFRFYDAEPTSEKTFKREEQSLLLVQFLERVVPETDESTALVNLTMTEAITAKEVAGVGYFDTGSLTWLRKSNVNPVIERVRV